MGCYELLRLDLFEALWKLKIKLWVISGNDKEVASQYFVTLPCHLACPSPQWDCVLAVILRLFWLSATVTVSYRCRVLTEEAIKRQRWNSWSSPRIHLNLLVHLCNLFARKYSTQFIWKCSKGNQNRHKLGQTADPLYMVGQVFGDFVCGTARILYCIQNSSNLEYKMWVK